MAPSNLQATSAALQAKGSAERAPQCVRGVTVVGAHVPSSDNFRHQPPFQGGVFGGICAKAKHKKAENAGVSFVISNPSRGATFKKLYLRSSAHPCLAR
jgi:hypothetical protein